MNSILLTSAGRRSYLVRYFQEAMAGKGLIIAGNSEECPAFYVADKPVITPLIYDDNFIPFLLDYCRNNDVSLLIPLFDIDIPVLAAHKDSFAAIGTRVVVPDSEIANVCNDKWETAQYLKENGFNVPKTYLGLEQCLEALRNNMVDFPLVVKPRWGMASIGTYTAYDDSELDALYKLVERDIERSYLKYESAAELNNAIIIQERLDGDEFGLDVICDLDSNYQNTSVKRKLAMRAGETDSAVTVNDEVLRDIGKRLASACPHPGNMDVDVFVTPNGAYVLELNARFGGGYPFSHAAGINLPQALVHWMNGEPVDPDILRAKPDVFAYKDLTIRIIDK